MNEREGFEARTCPEPNTGCLLWTGCADPKGYGRIGNGRLHRRYVRGMTVLAHRRAWEFAHGPIPDGLHVLHSCDTPSCVEVTHLRLGTNAENVADKVTRGRHRCRPQKVTDEQVSQIRAIWGTGPTQGEIGRMFGVHGAFVCRVLSGKRRQRSAA